MDKREGATKTKVVGQGNPFVYVFVALLVFVNLF